MPVCRRTERSCADFHFLQPNADRGIDEPVVQIAPGVIVMVADVVELSVGIDEITSEVVGQRCPRIETDAKTAVERLFAYGGYTHFPIIPFVPLFIGDDGVHMNRVDECCILYFLNGFRGQHVGIQVYVL